MADPSPGQTPEPDTDWFTENQRTYESLTALLKTTLTSLLQAAGIDYLSVSARTKTADSLAAKSQRYKDPRNEIFDVSAARVVTFVESDVTKVADLVRSSFLVFPEHSLDKTTELGVDRAGYRSVHFVCEFGDERCRLREFGQYKSMRFEVQIRTVLQDAWAEIEHDRNYKVAGVLPAPLQRRLFMLAGTLELADREFDALVKEIDAYTKEVEDKTTSGVLDTDVNSLSLAAFLPTRAKAGGLEMRAAEVKPEVVEEVQKFGLSSLKDVDALFSKDLFKAIKKNYETPRTPTGLLRIAMMFADAERYFRDAWGRHFGALQPDTISLLSDKYGAEQTAEMMRRHNVKVYKPRKVATSGSDTQS